MLDSRSLKCPFCLGEAEAHELGPLQVNLCSRCGGIWIGHRELKAVLSQGATALDELMGLEPGTPESHRASSSFACPVCRIPLHPTLLSGFRGVPIQTCYGCAGIFIEHDSFVMLDEQAPTPPPSRKPMTPEAIALVKQMDAMTADAQRRTTRALQILNSQAQSAGYGRVGFF